MQPITSGGCRIQESGLNFPVYAMEAITGLVTTSQSEHVWRPRSPRLLLFGSNLC
jgi:hypothetical protein